MDPRSARRKETALTLLSTDDDLAFRTAFESCQVAEFDHRAHVRLAYVYLAEHDTDTAFQRMRDALRGFLAHRDNDPSKYHDTLTRAWIMAVRHFMDRTPSASSADAFIDQNPKLLDAGIMMTHYSAEVLFSPEARAGFVEPDLDSIPESRMGEPLRSPPAQKPGSSW